MTFPIIIRPHVVKPMDARGWIGLGCYSLTIILLVMIWVDRTLLRDDFFKVIATAIILTGWNNGPVGWAYQSTKTGSEAAESSARIAEQAASAALPPAVPQDAKDAARLTADAADQQANRIEGATT